MDLKLLVDDTKKRHHILLSLDMPGQEKLLWFILLFLGAALLNSVGIIPAALSSTLSTLSKFFMVMALAAIGLKTDIRDVTKSGFLPMLHGFIISAIVVIVALLVQVLLGQV